MSRRILQSYATLLRVLACCFLGFGCPVTPLLAAARPLVNVRAVLRQLCKNAARDRALGPRLRAAFRAVLHVLCTDRQRGHARAYYSACICKCDTYPAPIEKEIIDADPLIVRAARGEAVERPPCWMMRQAGRYQKAYRDLASKYPSFRERSEVTDLIVEISLQPWNSFKPDGVILFSDILTPLSACGIPFEIDDNKGPLIESPITDSSGLKSLHSIELDRLSFVGQSLGILQKEVGPAGAAVLGFVGSPWTLATYVVEGKSTNIYKIIKTMMFTDPETLDGILSHLTKSITEYCRYQIDSGASYLQIFDSWGGQLPPHLWDKWSRPYIEQIISSVHETHAETPIMLYANGSGGLLERMGGTGADVIGLDWTIDMQDARRRLGPDQAVQGNLDPAVLFADKNTITSAVQDVLTKAGSQGHVLNLGHGVLVGTPEENVKHVFDLSKQAFYE